MDLRLLDASKSHPPTTLCSNQTSFASDQELDDFFANLDSCGAKSSILSIVPPFSTQVKPRLLENKNLSLVASLYKPENV